MKINTVKNDYIVLILMHCGLRILRNYPLPNLLWGCAISLCNVNLFWIFARLFSKVFVVNVVVVVFVVVVVVVIVVVVVKDTVIALDVVAVHIMISFGQ